MTQANQIFGKGSPLAFYDLALGAEETLCGMEGAPPPSPEQAGDVVAGRYVLKSLLGEGGASQVWVADQTEPVRREVAIKIVRPGLLTRPVSGRFNREHQVLARMEHPNIAAVFDAGELPDGRTYFAMEVVAGAAITRWCEERDLPVRDRLDVFLQACMALHHAHQRRILHRDLKPSNVLVTEVDGRPVVKVIDFGIAKTLAGDLSAGQEATLRGMILGTPRYMSPEQAGLTGQEVDARTDVFALGVLLYELLTGVTPLPECDDVGVPLPELLERVRHHEAERPSRRVALAGTPKGRALARSLRGDLDWITLRALQKERTRRYETAQALAEDVRRHLRNQPVAAGPPGVVYRAKKWVLRRRTRLTTAAVVAVSLGGGLAGTWWALQREEVQRQAAQRLKQVALSESNLAQQVSAQLEELLSNARKHVDAGMNTQMLRSLADECAAGMNRLANQPETEARLADELARLYDALEEPARALPWVERRWQLLKQTQGEQTPATLHALYTFGWRLIVHDAERAADVLRRAAEGFEALPDAHHAARDQALLARKELARALSRSGRHQEAVAMMSAALVHKGEADPAVAAAWLRDHAHILRSAGRNDEARRALHRALHLVPKDEFHTALRAYLSSTLALFDGTEADHLTALQASAERLRQVEATPGAADSLVLKVLISHVQLACRIPGCPGGEEAARRALAIAQSAGHETLLADAWIAVSETLRVTSRLAESEQVVRSAIAEVSQTKAEKWRVLELHRRLGDLLTARGDFAGALGEYETAAAGWFAKEARGRPREKEALIFTSFIKFWELAAAEASPLADARRLAGWQRKMEEWEARQGGLWSRGAGGAQSKGVSVP